MYLNVNILLGIISYQCLAICAINFGNDDLSINPMHRPYTSDQSHRFDDIKEVPVFEVKVLDYEHMKKCINLTDTVIIDVRSLDELTKTGIIPNSHHIPLMEISTAFRLEPKSFNKKYKFSKPDKNSKIIFSSCSHGIRSNIACYCLKHLGYRKLYNYIEGWSGWSSHGGLSQRIGNESNESTKEKYRFYTGESLEVD